MLVAMVIGAAVGWERESRGRNAGLRTHIMVALGAAGFTLIAMEFFGWLDRRGFQSGPSLGDPLRIIAAIVGGVGFLGAGAIIENRGRVKGLTTAASIWVVAATGMAAGAGFYIIAATMTVLALTTLVLVHFLERLYVNANNKRR